MQDKYITGISKLSIDDEITKVINTIEETGGKPMQFAIQNENSEIYRVITVIGIRATLSLVNVLYDLGLIDILKDDPSPNKYDGIFKLK